MNERRKEYPQLIEDIGYIKGTMRGLDDKISAVNDKISSHLKSSSNWNIVLLTTSVSLLLTIIGFSFKAGQFTNIINDHIKYHDKLIRIKEVDKVMTYAEKIIRNKKYNRTN